MQSSRFQASSRLRGRLKGPPPRPKTTRLLAGCLVPFLHAHPPAVMARPETPPLPPRTQSGPAEGRIGRDTQGSRLRMRWILRVHGTEGRLKEYSLQALRIVSGDSAQQVFIIERPSELRGSTVLILERRNAIALDLWLGLAMTHKRVHVATCRQFDFLLGSDFTYDDFRVWPAPPGAQGRAAMRCAGVPAGRLSLVPGAGLVSRSEDLKGGQVVRIVDFQNRLPFQGEHVPRRIEARRPGEGFRSEMELTDLGDAEDVQPSSLAPDRLEALGELTPFERPLP